MKLMFTDVIIITLLAGLTHPSRGTVTLPGCWVALPPLSTGAQLSTVLPVVSTRTFCGKKHIFAPDESLIVQDD